MAPRADDSQLRSGQQRHLTGDVIGNLGHGDYRIFRFGQRPVIALPAEPVRLKLAGLARYHPFTPKRKLFSVMIRFFILAHLDGLISTRRASPLSPTEDFGFGEWLELMRDRLDEPAIVATLVWPRQRYRGRAYVHLLRSSGQIVAFCKLAPSLQEDGLEREIAALTALRKEHEPLAAKVPQILCHGVFRGYRYALYEPLPAEAVPFTGAWSRLAPIIENLSGRVQRIARSEFDALPWWKQFNTQRGELSPAFLLQVERSAEIGVNVCRVHGDLMQSNLFLDKETLWICDWEASSVVGPYRTDEVCYRLSKDFRRCFGDPVGVVTDLLTRFEAESCPDPAGDLALSLAFLCSRGSSPAMNLARHWPSN